MLNKFELETWTCLGQKKKATSKKNGLKCSPVLLSVFTCHILAFCFICFFFEIRMYLFSIVHGLCCPIKKGKLVGQFVISYPGRIRIWRISSFQSLYWNQHKYLIAIIGEIASPKIFRNTVLFIWSFVELP